MTDHIKQNVKRNKKRYVNKFFDYSMEIQIFSNSKFGQLRVALNEKGETVVCLADVCKALDIDNPSDVKRRLDSSNIDTIEVSTKSANRFGEFTRTTKMTYIGEPNLYRCILSGEIPCPNCNEFAEQLCDENEKLAALYGSDSYLTLSYRSTVIAWLKGMMLYVMNGEKWTKEIQDYMEWSLRYDLWVKMNIIGKMLDEAQNEEVNATSNRGPKNMLELLKDSFKIEDLIILRKRLHKSVDMGTIRNQLQVWRNRKLVDFDNINDIIKKVKKQ